MENNKETNRVKSAVELYGDKREKKGREEGRIEGKEEGLIEGEEKGEVKGEKKRSAEVYERALKMGFDEKTAHTLAYGD